MSLSAEQSERMLEAVSGYCTGSPEATIRFSINHTVERFCRDVGGILLHLGPVAMDHANGIYYAVAPFGGVVFSVRGVSVDGSAIPEGVYRILYRDDGRAEIGISPYGTGAGKTLEMDVLWRPGERTTQMPSQWFDKNFDTIMHGSVASVLSQVGTAWGNPELARQFEDEYARDVHDAIYESRAATSPNGRLSCFDPNASWI